MNFAIASLCMLVILGVIITLVITTIKKGVSGIKLMLLGITIILISGIIVVDENSNLGGVEYLILLIGLIISIMGFGKKD